MGEKFENGLLREGDRVVLTDRRFCYKAEVYIVISKPYVWLSNGQRYEVNKLCKKGEKVKISNQEGEELTVETGTSVDLDDGLCYEVEKLIRVKAADEIWEENHRYVSEERELLHKQFVLLAEKSNNCSNEELTKLSEQMIRIHDALCIRI